MNDNENLINPNFDKRGYIQIYTGNGKGKTTASLGLALRALGRGCKVLFVLFTKGGSDYGELFAFREFSPKIKKHLKIIQAGLDRIVYSANVDGSIVEEFVTTTVFSSNNGFIFL